MNQSHFFLPDKQISDPRFQSAPIRQRLTEVLSTKTSDVTFGFFGDSLAEISIYAQTANEVFIIEKDPTSAAVKQKILLDLGNPNVHKLSCYTWPGCRATEVAQRIRKLTEGKIDRLLLDGNSGLIGTSGYISDGLNELKKLALLADHIWVGISCLGGRGTRNQITSLIDSHDLWSNELDKLGYEIIHWDAISTITGTSLRAVINYEILEVRRS
jgi:hypothetical protein